MKFRLLQHKLRYDTFERVNNKGADQTVRMRRLVCAFAVHIFSRRDPTIYVDLADGDTVDRDGLLYILQVCAHAYGRQSLH